MDRFMEKMTTVPCILMHLRQLKPSKFTVVTAMNPFLEGEHPEHLYWRTTLVLLKTNTLALCRIATNISTVALCSPSNSNQCSTAAQFPPTILNQLWTLTWHSTDPLLKLLAVSTLA